MPLTFFQALNPLSKYSGIERREQDGDRIGMEIIDKTLPEFIYHAWVYDNYSFTEALQATNRAIIGRHYSSLDSSKGLLDFFILPLLSRKLLTIGYSSIFTLMLSITFCAPIEAVRSVTGLLITMILTPIVLALHLIKRYYYGFPLYPLNITNHDRISHLNLDIPNEYICPISGTIMTDPVSVANQPNHRFERASITRWLSNHLTNPLDRSPLGLEDLQPDVALRQEIEEYIRNQLLLSQQNHDNQHDLDHPDFQV